MEDISLDELREFEAAAAAAEQRSSTAHIRGLPNHSSRRSNVQRGPPPPDEYDPFDEDVSACLRFFCFMLWLQNEVCRTHKKNHEVWYNSRSSGAFVHRS